MKRMILILICITCTVLLCGCFEITEIEQANEKQENASMFVEVEEAMSFKIIYHKETKVMYAVSDAQHNRGTFTLLVNADGTPMLYKGSE